MRCNKSTDTRASGFRNPIRCVNQAANDGSSVRHMCHQPSSHRLHEGRRLASFLLRRFPRRHRCEIERQVGSPDITVGLAVFINVHAGPVTGLCKDSDIAISRDAIAGTAVFAINQSTMSAALPIDRGRADREPALAKNFLVPSLTDVSRPPRTDTRNPRVLQVRIDVEAN